MNNLSCRVVAGRWSCQKLCDLFIKAGEPPAKDGFPLLS